MKDIPGYEGRYAVTEDGKFYSFLDSHGRLTAVPKLRKPQPNKKRWGYLYISLRIDGKYKNWIAHRLVALTYIPNPNDYPEVNHIDGDKNNISVSNLEWCTSSQNKHHKYQVLKIQSSEKQKETTRLLMSKKVGLLDDLGNVVQEFISVTEAQKFFGYKKGNISTCCRGTTKQAYGKMWKYI